MSIMRMKSVVKILAIASFLAIANMAKPKAEENELMALKSELPGSGGMTKLDLDYSIDYGEKIKEMGGRFGVLADSLGKAEEKLMLIRQMAKLTKELPEEFEKYLDDAEGDIGHCKKIMIKICDLTEKYKNKGKLENLPLDEIKRYINWANENLDKCEKILDANT
ncbi:MAG: hypothetical protein ABIH83_03075 [Candidatus Micrarchaeota archaeon]